MHHMMAGPPGIMGGPAALGGLGMIGGGFPGMMNMGMDGMSMGMYPGHGFSRLGGLNMMPGWGPMPRVRHRYYDSWDDIYDDDNDEDDEEPFIRELRRKRRLRRHAMGGGMGSPFGMGGGFMGAGELYFLR